jgi:YVTN family beta-propeller protein
MRTLRIGLVALSILLAAAPAMAYTVYITNQGEDTITIIDGQSKKVLDTVKISQGRPHNAILSPDGKYLLRLTSVLSAPAGLCGSPKSGRALQQCDVTREVNT